MTEGSPQPAVVPMPVPAGDEATFPKLAHALGWLGATGLSVGMAVGTLTQWRLMPDWVLRNRLPPPARNLILAVMGVGLLVFVLPALVSMVMRGRAGLDAVHRVAMRLSPLVVLGPLPAMMNDRAWAGFELVFTVLAAVLSLVAYLTFRQSLAQAPILPARWFTLTHRVASWRDGPVVVAIAATVFYAVWFSVFSLSNHYQLLTSSFDLGIENNLIWQASHLNGPLFRSTPLGGAMTHLGLHQTYFSYLLAIPYRLWPDARLLLIMQSCVLGGAGFVLFHIAREKVGGWPAAGLAWAYALYPPLHGANLYDFHYQPLSIIFLFALVYCVERGFWKRAALCVLLTLSLREDMGLLVAVICVWLALRNFRPLLMLGFIAASLFHFVLLKMIVMPYFLGGASSYINQYQFMLGEGDTGFGGVLKTLLSNPGYTMNWLLEPGKQLYVMQVLGPLVFLPLLRRSNAALLMPGFFFTLLSTKYPALMMISFQYSAYWVPFLFLAVVTTLSSLALSDRLAMKAALLTMLLATVLHTRQFGAVLHVENVHVHFHTAYHLVPTERDHARRADFELLAKQIPDDARVAASELLLPQFSSRASIYTLRMGVHDGEWLIADVPVRSDELPQIRAALDGEFGVVDLRGDFMLARRGHPKDRNAEAQKFTGR